MPMYDTLDCHGPDQQILVLKRGRIVTQTVVFESGRFLTGPFGGRQASENAMRVTGPVDVIEWLKENLPALVAAQFDSGDD